MSDTQRLREMAVPVTGGCGDYDTIVDAARACDFVLIGEASHGTHEFYRERARITRRLIEEVGFGAVAVEADWPDAYRVNCYVRHVGDDASADDALGGFKRFPTWMWRNQVVLEFVDWLRNHNASVGSAAAAGFYGLDLYSLHTSIEAVLSYLDRTDPAEAQRARGRYACFNIFGEDPQTYGYAATRNPEASCEDEVVKQLVELRGRAREYTHRGRASEDDFFFAEQNALLVKNAEEYYRTMFRGGAASWNLRDRHMCETLYALSDHLGSRGVARPKIVVWAHNSHLGDARATQMSGWGEWNLGQLVRERSGAKALNVGFTTYNGTVTAASDWDEPAQVKRVRNGMRGSYEALLHEVGGDFALDLREAGAREAIPENLLERAIGVIYRPDTERQSHYFDADLAAQFDFVVHLDNTRALEPLEPGQRWTGGEAPETFPSGM